jgi:NTP pyrophosphatase (non-canonical NTP hydrolase)
MYGFGWSPIVTRAYYLHGDTFADLQLACGERSLHWHPEDNWSTLEWTGAMAGEAGEAANVAKKLKRFDSGMSQALVQTREELVKKLGAELADTIMYAVMVARKEGINLKEAILEKYNLTCLQEHLPFSLEDGNAIEPRGSRPSG